MVFHTFAKSKGLSEALGNQKWRKIAFGQHHALCLDAEGRVWAIGRSGRSTGNFFIHFSLVSGKVGADKGLPREKSTSENCLLSDHAWEICRADYGRLGLGQADTTDGKADAQVPVIVPGLEGQKCVDIACGTCVSFAVTEDGKCFRYYSSFGARIFRL